MTEEEKRREELRRRMSGMIDLQTSAGASTQKTQAEALRRQERIDLVTAANAPTEMGASELAAQTESNNRAAYEQATADYNDKDRWKGSGLIGTPAAMLINKFHGKDGKIAAREEPIRQRLTQATAAANAKEKRLGLDKARARVGDQTAAYDTNTRQQGHSDAQQQNRQGFTTDERIAGYTRDDEVAEAEGGVARTMYRADGTPVTFRALGRGKGAVDPDTGEKVNIQGLYPSPPDASALKASREDEEKLSGRTNMTSLLDSMAGKYFDLAAAGAAVSGDQGVMKNVGNFMRSQVPAVEGAMGTQAGSIRSSIEMMKPTLINTIRQATGMSAKAMDSDTELKLQLQAVTDPSTDVTVNLEALLRLNEAYGLGMESSQLDNLIAAAEAVSSRDSLRGDYNDSTGRADALIDSGGGARTSATQGRTTYLAPEEQSELEMLLQLEAEEEAKRARGL